MVKYIVRSVEYKLEAIRLWQSSDKTAAQVEDELGLRHGSLYEWKHHLLVKGGAEEADSEEEQRAQERVEQLELENKRLSQELAILKHIVGYRYNRLAQTPDFKMGAMRIPCF